MNHQMTSDSLAANYGWQRKSCQKSQNNNYRTMFQNSPIFYCLKITDYNHSNDICYQLSAAERRMMTFCKSVTR